MEEGDEEEIYGDDDSGIACPECDESIDLTDYVIEGGLKQGEEITCQECDTVMEITEVDWSWSLTAVRSSK